MPLRYHWKAMECPKRVNMLWGKGTEVYLFSTGKERDQELGKRVTTWCGRREVRLNIIYKVLWSPLMQLKLHGAGAWRTMILLRIRKRSFFWMAEFLYTKKSNLIIFLLLASRENTSWKVFIWLFWNSKGLVTTEIRFLVKKKRNRDLKIKVNFSFWTLLTFL